MLIKTIFKLNGLAATFIKNGICKKFLFFLAIGSCKSEVSPNILNKKFNCFDAYVSGMYKASIRPKHVYKYVCIFSIVTLTSEMAAMQTDVISLLECLVGLPFVCCSVVLLILHLFLLMLMRRLADHPLY